MCVCVHVCVCVCMCVCVCKGATRCARLGHLDWPAQHTVMLAGWRYASTTSGAPSVAICGTTMQPEWCAGSWGTTAAVSDRFPLLCVRLNICSFYEIEVPLAVYVEAGSGPIYLKPACWTAIV